MFQYNLGQLFDQVAMFNEEQVAIKQAEGDHTNYSELNTLSNKIANYLLSLNVKQNDVVAILNNKSKTSYAIMIACLKIGAIYTNLDPKSPIERFNKMIAICNPKLLFYYQSNESIINSFSNSSVKSIEYFSSEFSNYLNGFDGLFPLQNKEVSSSTPAYIMFTSGSTGFPKGVVISHQNVLNFINWTKATYRTESADIFTNLNPMHFDNSVFDFYASLFTGASIIPINESQTRNPRRLIEILNTVSPTIWFSVPSMLVYVLNMRALRSEDLPSLRTVTFGGEGFPKNQLRTLWKFWGDRVDFINVYGPTECTCICSSYRVSENDLANDELLPLGPMAPNFYAHIMNDKGLEVKQGQIGELCIGGPNVGLGYYNNPEKTNESFIPHPNINSFNEIVYRSGDLVKYDTGKDHLLFCGRKDNQIKRMGYRIELEEIENALNSIDFIEESAVVYIDNDKYKSKILACLRTENKDENQINSILSNHLPAYMIPDGYFYFENLPKNQNGKINRLKLKEEFNA